MTTRQAHLNFAIEHLKAVWDGLNITAHECESCHHPEYEAWDEYQAAVKLDGMIERLTTLREQRWANQPVLALTPKAEAGSQK